jgi:hypothetical protein
MGGKRNNKLIDTQLMSDRDKAVYDALPADEKLIWLGFGIGERRNFDVPEFNKLPWEQVHQKGNAFITLGLDRNGDETSGFGAQGATHCGAVDIVAGRKGFLARKRRKRSGTIKIVDNDFVLDAARLYLSQRANPDGYFRLMPGNVGNTSEEEPRSAAVLKADAVRIVGRENIKLVTRTDLMNSQGGILTNMIKGSYGIDLMAMNGAGGQQPLVKGDNLVELLTTMIQLIQQLASTFTTYVVETRKFQTALITHDHLAPFFGNMTAPDFRSNIPTGINTLINNVCNVDVGARTTQMAFNQLIFEYLNSPGGAEFGKSGGGVGNHGHVDGDGEPGHPHQLQPGPTKNILSIYNSTN